MDILQHKNEVMEVRQLYQCRRSRAKFDPSAFASIIIDGMDQVESNLLNLTYISTFEHKLICYLQAKTHVPYNSVEKMSQKDVQQSRLIQRIHGVIVHGIGTFLYLVEPAMTPKGSNQGSKR
jgi:hypothetical protein